MSTTAHEKNARVIGEYRLVAVDVANADGEAAMMPFAFFADMEDDDEAVSALLLLAFRALQRFVAEHGDA